MRTTVELPDDLLRHAKVRAALDGVKLKDLIARYVADGLGRGASPSSVGGQRSRRRGPLPVMHKANAGHPIPALTNAEVQAILDAEDAARANRPARR